MVLERSEINKLLNNSDKSLMEVYLDLHEEFSKKYGENTVVLMEVGSFFEVYGVDNEPEKTKLSKKTIAKILSWQAFLLLLSIDTSKKLLAKTNIPLS